jgi:hypothetical protein
MLIALKNGIESRFISDRWQSAFIGGKINVKRCPQSTAKIYEGKT